MLKKSHLYDFNQKMFSDVIFVSGPKVWVMGSKNQTHFLFFSLNLNFWSTKVNLSKKGQHLFFLLSKLEFFFTPKFSYAKFIYAEIFLRQITILRQKHFFTPIFLRQYFVTPIFFYANIFLRQYFFTPKFFYAKIFLRQNFFTPKFFYAKIIFYAKFIYAEIILRQKIILRQIYLHRIYFTPKT